MSFDGNQFGIGFDIGGVVLSSLTRALQRFGVVANMMKRTRGVKDSETGHSPETWSNNTVFILCFPVQSDSKETGAGDAVTQRYEIFGDTAMNISNRLVWGGETYQIETGPEMVYHGEVIYYRHVAVKLT